MEEIDAKKGIVNIYTQGMQATRKVPEFQIVLPLHPETALDIIHNLVESIESGTNFEPDKLIWGIIRNYPIKLTKIRIKGRSAFRVILPDATGLFPENSNCDPYFKIQSIQFIK